MGKDSYDREYERGVKDGQNGNAFEDKMHELGTIFNTSKEDAVYDKGYEWGAEHRNEDC